MQDARRSTTFTTRVASAWRVVARCAPGDSRLQTLQPLTAQWLSRVGDQAWAHVHGALHRRAHCMTQADVAALAHGMALVARCRAAHALPTMVAQACLLKLLAVAWSKGQQGRPHAHVVMCLAVMQPVAHVPPTQLAWVLAGLEDWGGKTASSSVSEVTVQRLLGLALVACTSAVPAACALSERALVTVHALAEDATAAATTHTLALGLLHALALQKRFTARELHRDRARRALQWLGSPVRTRQGGLAAAAALEAVPKCIVCLGTACEDAPGTQWRVMPCTCMLHAHCFDGWTATNAKFWDQTPCLRCRADLSTLVLRTLAFR